MRWQKNTLKMDLVAFYSSVSRATKNLQPRWLQVRVAEPGILLRQKYYQLSVADRILLPGQQIFESQEYSILDYQLFREICILYSCQSALQNFPHRRRLQTLLQCPAF